VAEIPKPPAKEPISLPYPVFFGRTRSVNVPKPPDGIEFVADGYVPILFWMNRHALPL